MKRQNKDLREAASNAEAAAAGANASSTGATYLNMPPEQATVDTDRIVGKIQSKRVRALKEVTDKIRKLSLGALAVIWALLSHVNSESSLPISPSSRVILALAALAIIAALAVDLFWSGFKYLYTYQLGEERFMPRAKFTTWREMAIWTNLATLAVGLFLLGYAIAATVGTQLKAQIPEIVSTKFQGDWCAGSIEDNSFRCVKIVPVHGEGAIITFQKWKEEIVRCMLLAGNETELEFRCSQADYDFKSTADSEVVRVMENKEIHTFRRIKLD